MVTKEGFGRYVWTPNAKHGFVLARLRDIGAQTMTLELLDTGECVTAAYDEVFPAEEDKSKTVDDNCALMYLNEGTLLNNCRLRYAKKQIYTYVANILISINPYEQISELYSIAAIRKYEGKSLGALPPHVFAIADKAYRDMRRLRESQSVIVSGESGAGKTESQKYILRYLCESWGSTAGPIEQRILETNPILEAFGNAKTLRNNNSSRFGKFVEIHFGAKYAVGGGFVSHYLLEKSRICMQQAGERNYHVFYQLIAGADESLYKALGLGSPDTFNYLKRGCTQFFTSPSTMQKIGKERRSRQGGDLRDELLDDFGDLQRLRTALASIGLSLEHTLTVLQTVAAVLHLGNVCFVDDVDGSAGGCTIDPHSFVSLRMAAKLLGVDAEELKFGLISRVMQPTKGGIKGTIIRVALKPHEGSAARDALAKAVYSRLFDSIVAAINRCIPFGDCVSYIGVLDIAGFEFFTVNSFEQFCINYCNEKLQYFFNERILKHEQELYKQEGLNVPVIEYCDNQDCIELFEERATGLLDMLDEEARLPRPSPLHFTANVHQQHKSHFRLSTPRMSKLREHRELRDDEGFLIRHYAGTVCYQTAQFLDKNNDALHTSLEMILEHSNNPLISRLFNGEGALNGVPEKNRHSSNKLVIASVSSKFRSQLNVLLQKLKDTGTHFVRCIKPNSDMRAGHFEGIQILSQLKCAGMTSVLKLMQKGYPSRTQFSNLYDMYKGVLPPQLARLDPRLFCRCLFRALGLSDQDYKFGLTKVFFRPGKFAEFDQMLHQDESHMRQLVRKVQSWLHRVRWKKAQYGVLSCIKLKNKILYRASHLVKIQSAVRGHLARKKNKPRLIVFRRATALLARVKELTALTKQISPSSQQKWSPVVSEIERGVQKLISEIKDFTGPDTGKMDLRYNALLNKTETTLQALKQQVAVEKQLKIKQMEEKIRQQKQQELLRKQQEEQLEKERIERRLLEERRLNEEIIFEQRQAVIEEQRRIEEQIKKQRQEKMEQERLDAELVRRLASEDQRLHVLEFSAAESEAKQAGRYNLSSWKYADLRDTINTSTDIDLLTACKEEFHRRMRIYNEWKERNQGANEVVSSRAPSSLLSSVAGCSASVPQSTSNIQRYFKVPFERPSERKLNTDGIYEYCGSQRGMWYAHFDGQWIARQMEVHPNKNPVLLVAGRDDVDMCELSLDDTQLARKKGAQIGVEEFEGLWQRYGGQPYPTQTMRNCRF